MTPQEFSVRMQDLKLAYVRISCRKAEFLEEKRQLHKEYEYGRDRHLPEGD